ncbi:serine protease snake-like [Condylostylus longicornis]|uniref:serine protease snake-like n=1 Tax=Condylostylus longicornis TaxID=2530218 RepID=UPI00244E38EC|nr:serine protease snake-like [Condylostylus longicornis]
MENQFLCFREAPNFVKLGDVNLNIREGVVATQRFRIDKIIIHPNYNADLNYHDIALIKLSKPAVFTIYVHPIRMWPQRDIPYTMAFAMGYGATTFGRIPTGVLSFLNFTLIGNKECNESLAHIEETPYGIVDSQICAINTQTSADICQGDSGGPLQLHLPGLERPNYFLIGVTSFGLICGSRSPSVYTRVHSYLEWIEDTIWPD